ncbi:CHAD domain-containing protein [Marinigracilibium pacificum]|uniref:CHAD domain-containing protein n=1 Tax=Marinigracilibium pacificum TaxID=2729599 RepID=A0A848J135_9BACT|nr:CHAD domain-containing protein [Marinigracilibium pacificum]NMM49526.1 CHAD domain-containing protein [Marinigracilibium pacificum]
MEIDFDLSVAIKKYLVSNISLSIDLIDDDKVDLEIKVHKIRTNIKKIRGSLRLIREYLPEYKKLNIEFRDMARRLADYRDATSAIEALDRLTEYHSSQLYKTTFKKIKASLIKHQETLQYRNNINLILTEIKDQLIKSLEKAKDFDFQKSFKSIKKGLSKVYEKGQKIEKQINIEPSPSLLHEWRKQVKYHAGHLQIIFPLWPELFSAFINEYYRLSNYLGEDRDLYLLKKSIENNPDSISSESESELINALIDFNNSKLQSSALTLGRKLYSISTNEYIKFLGSGFKQTL